jgi:small-conductance mechanosensitive channel
VPNAEFAKQQLVNFSQRDHIPLELPISLPAGLQPRAIRDLLGRIQRAVQTHPRLDARSVTARLTAQASDSVSAEVWASTVTADERDFAAIREEVLLAVMETMADYQAGVAPVSSLPHRRAA